MGACRRHELYKLQYRDVHDLKSALLVTIRDTKTKAARKFTVIGKYYDICKKYMDLRPKECTARSFFVNYANGKCTVQNVGINKFGNMGKHIATYLNLPDPNLYTGHCFRRSSATMLIDADGDITPKQHSKSKSTTEVENYVDKSSQSELVPNQILNLGDYNQINNLITIAPSTSTAVFTNIDPGLLELHNPGYVTQ